jgi:type IV pilus assembly protein PilY1
LGLLTCLGSARADEPDQRDIPPFVMIVADTSGSMEWLPNCKCTTLDCGECLPDCSLLNLAGGEPPAGKKSRWSVLLETLTGKFINFSCVTLARTVENRMTYDLNYSRPYNRPWTCSSGDRLCDYSAAVQSPLQIENGLLDNYATRIRFGLATFDGMRTFTGRGDLVTAVEFNNNMALSSGESGSYSYGGAKAFRYPSCGEDYMIDSGIRSKLAPEGGLISLDTCTTPPCDIVEMNTKIQTALLKARTFGGTPIAGALDDLNYHFKNDFTDPYASCRQRYAVLITDGQPDDDFREYQCDCAAVGGCPGNPSDYKCPYPMAQDAAKALVTKTLTTDAAIAQLFVVGMSINDPEARSRLNLVASNGGTSDTDGDGNEAFFADNPDALTATLDTMLGSLTRPISRSVPAFATGLAGAQYQLSTGFKVTTVTPPPGYTAPWKGILERRRFLCDGSTLESPDLSTEDKFDELLNKQGERTLYTALPSNPTPALVEGWLPRGTATAACGLNGCSMTALSGTDASLLGSSVTAAEKTVVMDWMYGKPGSVREKNRLGDIYHASPTVVGPPVEDPGDQSYTLFSESPLIQERPVIAYVNSNDGILHAFSVEDYPPTNSGITPTYHAGLTYKAGQELWGFVPPILLNDLKPQLAAHQLLLDATPVVKDVFFSKSNAPSASDYKTVLITGMRSGGKGYVALDVTDPTVPKFLWQFADADMGQTYGQPEIVQAVYGWPVGQPAKQRAMAILPGGKGTLGVGPGCTAPLQALGNVTTKLLGGSTPYTTRSIADGASSRDLTHRDHVQCWDRVGRSLYFVDVETGGLIKKIFDSDSLLSNGTVFPSPVVGSPTAYQDSVGTIATEGFVMDADGVLWRIDLSDPDPHKDDALLGWTVRPFHDLFWDAGIADGEKTYEKPILSLDSSHRVVVITGTGDTDNFEKSSVRNRIVSLTEITKNSAPSGPDDYQAAMNWELRSGDATADGSAGFVQSELVTGAMSLYQGQLMAASFISVKDVSNQCSQGLGRLWSFDYNTRDTTANAGVTNPATFPPKRVPVVSSAGPTGNTDLTLFNVTKARAEPNLLVQGLGATQRMSCGDAESNLNSYFAPPNKGIQQSTTKPSIWVVAQASGNNRARIRAGSQLGSIQVQLDRPLSFSTISSWAGSIE